MTQCKKENRNFSLDKLGSHHLTIKDTILINLTIKDTLTSCASWYDALERAQHNLFNIFAQKCITWINNEKILNQPNCECELNIHKMASSILQKYSNEKEKLRNYHQLEVSI